MEITCYLIVVTSRSQVFSVVVPVVLLSLCILLYNSQAPVAASVVETASDKLALLSFKSLISEDPSSSLATWNNSIDICRWQGVACSTIIRSGNNNGNESSSQKRVTSLTLSSMDLAGRISPSLSNLSFLTSLSLGRNRLHGTIPPELGMLSQLRLLNLSSNSLEGQIPPSLGNCTRLEYVDLFRNGLEGEIPKELFNGLYELKAFRASANKLTGMVAPQLGNVTSLTWFSLGSNLLKGQIPEEIGQLTGLYFLDLDSNALLGNIPLSLYNLSNLRILGLADNHLTGSIPSSLGGLLLPNIRLLNMYMNNFEGPLPPSLGNASNIQELDLSLNRLSGPIPSNIGSSRSITKLELGGNQMLEAGDWSFLSSLVNCTQLQYINLAGNNLEGELPNSIGNFSSQLQELHLQGNQVTGRIPSSIGYLTGLLMLNLERNNLSGIIPKSIGMLKRLLRLHIRSNNLSGEIPSPLSNLSLLIDLDLSRNNIMGGIPMSVIRGMKSLQYLDLSYNKLTGSTIQLSSSLINVDLSYNSLTGSLPPNFSVMATNLNLLNLSYNGLSGEIPPDALAGFQVLQELRLENNSFEGYIPISLAKLRGLQVLDISCNQFIGSIPPDLGSLTLNYLNISYNNLQGPVPELGIFNKLNFSSIEGNNALCGGTLMLHLPSCLVQQLNHGNNMKKEIAWVVPVIIIPTIICICIFGWMLHTSHQMKKMRNDGSSHTPMLSGSHRSDDNMIISIGGKTSCRSIRISVSPLTQEKTRRVWEGPLRISYMEIVRATCGFSRENLLGSCGFGSVYKGTLLTEDDGSTNGNTMVVAVKVLHLERKGAEKSFEVECSILKGIRHHNLVPVLTCCVGVDDEGKDFKALVYEFMPNGNLDDWLHPKLNDSVVGRKRELSLVKRLDIAIDVACALEYLHLHCQNPIIHCDIKPSNILLDQDMCARVGDFGLARLRPLLLDDLMSSFNSTIGLKGSYGYIAPEYGLSGEVSALGDIYSFGILLLEMFTGRKPTDGFFTDNLSIHTYVELAFPQDIVTVVDPNLCLMENNDKREISIENIDLQRMSGSSKFHKCLESVFLVGLLCSKQDPKDRLQIEDACRDLNVARTNYIACHMHESLGALGPRDQLLFEGVPEWG